MTDPSIDRSIRSGSFSGTASGARSLVVVRGYTCVRYAVHLGALRSDLSSVVGSFVAYAGGGVTKIGEVGAPRNGLRTRQSSGLHTCNKYQNVHCVSDAFRVISSQTSVAPT